MRLGAIAAHDLEGGQRGFVDVRTSQHHLVGSSHASGKVGHCTGPVLGDVRGGGQAMAQKGVGFVDKEHSATALVWL